MNFVRILSKIIFLFIYLATHGSKLSISFKKCVHIKVFDEIIIQKRKYIIIQNTVALGN